VKLERLELLAFGSLRDVALDLGASAPCLHVIYGPNEAGKSTALRALSGLFYGIPATTPDAHSIEPARLRVGALLCDARGRRLHVVRRKGLKQTLLGADGEPLAPAEASWVNAGMPESTFHTLFGLSYDSLHRGAEELLSSAGDLGQSLFTAAVGGGRVRRVLESLRAEADALFRPRGRTQRLNAALLQYEQAKHKKGEGVKPEAFALQQRGIEEATAEGERLTHRSLQLRAERERLERARRVLPMLDKRAVLVREREALGEVRRLPEDASKERAAAQAAEREALLRVEHAQAEIEQLEQQQRELADEGELAPGLEQLPESVLEGLRDRLSAYRRGLRELPRRREALARTRLEVERVAARLSPPPAAEAIEGLRLAKGSEARVRELSRRSDALASKHRDLQLLAASKRDLLDSSRKQLQRLWANPADPQVELPLLSRFALPREETIAEFERAFTELAGGQRALASKLSELDARIEHNRRERDALMLAGAPPSEAALDDARRERDQCFAELRALLASAEAEPAHTRAVLERAAALTAQADQLGDRLRREADRVARAARLAADQASLERERAERVREREALHKQQLDKQAAWRALFAHTGVKRWPHAPREVSARLVEQRAGEAQCEQLERELSALERELLATDEQRHKLADAWSKLARELGVATEASPGEVEATLELRAELLQRHDSAEKLARELAELEGEQQAFEAETRALCAEHAPALLALPAETAADRLIAQQRAAHAARARHQQLMAAIDARRSALEAAQREHAQAARRMALLMEAAGVGDVAALERAELASQRVRELEAFLAELQREIWSASDGQDPAQIAEVAGDDASLDRLALRLDEVDRELAELDDARQRAAHQLASCRAGIQLLRDSHEAGDAAVEAASQLEDVRALAEEYLRVRLAASVLKREIASYRDRHRAPILRVAGDLFARLTLAAYTGLDVDYGADDEPILTCVRNDDSRVTVAGLSAGTRDQLYLALRLASIAHLAEGQELLPLILDDVLIHFDDDRARAALSVLGSFSETTQVLFFTHHQRLCELAAEALSESRLRLHQLQLPPRLRAISLQN
jgi:uncharacterized protein YhaN